MSKNWYLSTSDDYLSGFENEEFEANATSAFEDILVNSPESYDVFLNGEQIRMVVQDQEDSQTKKILTRLGTLKRGDIVEFKDFGWLVIDFVNDNKMHQVAKAKLCNAEISITPDFSGSKEPIGYDDWNNPIYPDNNFPLPPISIPCIAEMKLVDESLDKAINLEEDKIQVTIPYLDIAFKTFEIYDQTYNVKSIDRTKAINGRGLLIIVGERS